jgi:hypothetical protein
VGRLATDPERQVVASVEMPVLHLAVPRCGDDFETGTFSVDVLTPGAPAQEVAENLIQGCRVRVSGTLDVGETPAPDGRSHWGLQLVADEISVEEIDVGDD